MNVNIPYADMLLPTQGPENPFGDRNRFANQNALAGHVEEQDMTEHAFRQQHLTFSILGYAANPSIDPNAPATLGSVEAAQANEFATVDTIRQSNKTKKELKRKRKNKGDLDIVDGEGAYVGPWASWQGDEPQSLPEGMEPPADEEEEPEEEDEEVTTKRAKAKRGTTGQEYSVFHGKQMADYQGRTYMHPPVSEAPQLNQEAGTQDCFIPKVCIHTWTGHTQGVSVVRTFPGTGHMFLSGSMDTKIKACFTHLFGPSLTIAPTALGHLYPWKLSANVPWSRQGCQGRDVLQRRASFPVLRLRPSDEALGHRNWPMHQAFQQWQDPLRRTIPPRRG
jgi:pre-mRNA-processing factor 17